MKKDNRMLKNSLVFVVLSVLSVGCIGQSKKVEQTDTTKMAFKTQADIAEPAPIVNVGNGNKGKISITIPDLPESKREIVSNGNADLTSTYSMETQISMAVAFLFFSIACLLLKMVMKGSKTASLTLGLIDNAVASCVSMATTSNNEKDMSLINHFKSELSDLKRHL